MKIRILFLSVLLLTVFNHQAFCAKRIVKERGGSYVKAVKYENGDWELLVDGKPYFIKGTIFNPVMIGESPGEATMRDWMYYDENKNGKNDEVTIVYKIYGVQS